MFPYSAGAKSPSIAKTYRILEGYDSYGDASDLAGLNHIYHRIRNSNQTDGIFEVFHQYRNLVPIVGTGYTGPLAMKIAASAKTGKRLLLLPETANSSDENAIMVLMASHNQIPTNDLPEDPDFSWIRIGYLPASYAAKLKKHWPENTINPWAVTAVVAKFVKERDGMYASLTTEQGNAGSTYTYREFPK